MKKEDAFEILEISSILEKASSFALTEMGRKEILSTRPYSEKDLPSFLSILKEMSSFLDKEDSLPFRRGEDISKSLNLALKGRSLEEKEFVCLKEEIESASSIKKMIESHGDEYPLLLDHANRLTDLENIAKRIDEVIAPTLEIRDSASKKLAGIRKEKDKVKTEMNRILPRIIERYASYLNSMAFAFKNGHYALPVSMSYKNSVRGLVQDISASENTVFIEPEEVLEKDNRLAELDAEERVEIARILRELTETVVEHGPELLVNASILSFLDTYSARVRYGRTYNGHLASLSEDASLFIPQAFHPLLEVETIVKNDFTFTSKRRVTLISGPNAGGKTVALKTLGVIAILFKMAFLLPCFEGAIIPYFKHVYADIGDQQSLQENLSTFSAHIASLSQITSDIGGKDLLLLDEVGTGTSPSEGEALAKAILDYILEKHSYALVTSHFDGVKQYALAKEGISNASMIFDKETMKPTYVLSLGTVGDSFGLEIASSYGLSKQILDNAKRYKEKDTDSSLQKAMNELSSLSAKANEEKKEYEKKLAELDKKEKDLKSKEHALKNKEEKLLSSVEKKKEELLEKAEKEIEGALHDLRSPNVKLHEVIEAKRKLESLRKNEDSEVYDEELKEGDYASIPSLGIEGVIESLSAKKAVLRDHKGFKYSVNPVSLHRISSPKKEERKEIKNINLDSLGYGKSLSMELNIIGLYADEAELELERYLDACRMKGFHRVRIIHGFGTGALRRMVNNYLASHKEFIKGYEAASEAEGGGGATIVYLK